MKNGIPIEYITKRVQFLSDTFHIYPGVFIPRLETEYFVELIPRILNFIPEKILEIGTGSGVIAITLARLFPSAQIFATDIVLTALQNAKENIKNSKLDERIYLIGADLFSPINASFDLIISNPPYIPVERIKYLPKSVKEFEPISAINGGRGGLRFIKEIISQGLKYLNRNGAIGIEIDEEQVSVLTTYLRDFGLPFLFKKDLFDRYRYLFLGNIKGI